MNREQVVANVLAMHRRMNPPGGKCLCGHETPLGRLTTEHVARAVLDAILPQVTTVAELEALPYGSLLLRQPDGYETPRTLTWRRGYYQKAGGGYAGSLFYMDGMADVTVVLAAGPLTVIWQPEVTA